MTPLTCDEVDELAGAYALGALDEDERAAIESHLAGHWHEEYASARAAVLALASTAPEATPSPELRARVLEIARQERPRQRRRRVPVMLLAGAGAAAALALLVSSGTFDTPSEPPQQLEVRDQSNGAFLEVTVEEASTHASIRLGGLPPRPGDPVYQIWLTHNGQPPRSISIVGADRDGPWTRPAEMRLKRGDRVTVTAEPDSSRAAPTQAPILTGQY